MATFIDLLAEQRPPHLALGDPRPRTVDGITELLSPHFSRIEITEHTIGSTGTAEQPWASLTLTYDAFALTEEGREALKVAFSEAIGADEARCGHGMLMVRAWKQKFGEE